MIQKKQMTDKERQRLNKLKEIDLLQNTKLLAGIDEAGRGPLAGPVVVGIVIMQKDSFIEGVNDSKKVSEKKREKLYDEIINEAIAWGVGIVDEKVIDEINILNATKKALTMAIESLETKPEKILVDALTGINTLRNTVYINYKRRCYKLQHCCSFYYCKSYKGQNYERV